MGSLRVRIDGFGTRASAATRGGSSGSRSAELEAFWNSVFAFVLVDPFEN